MKNCIIILTVLIAFTTMKAQTEQQNGKKNTFYVEKHEKCSFDSTRSAELYKLLGDGWGYNYDSLMIDLDKWQDSPYVLIDSIGASVQNRALWELTISDSLFLFNTNLKHRITIHARTHPDEVYSFYATRAIINMLTGNSELAKRFRKYAIFNIVPIYNPDGVELGYPRQNANGVDLERDWDSEDPQPESAALKALYLTYMNSWLPIDIALNMHNDAYRPFRHFYYHHENGTSLDFSLNQKEFISGVHSYWPSGIANWDYMVTWAQGTPTQYPESWFWLNYQESVLALTFEEIITGTELEFIKTAEALLNGMADYLELEQLTDVKEAETADLNNYKLLSAYPNPFNPTTTIEYNIPKESQVIIRIYDLLGREVAELVNENKPVGKYRTNFTAKGINSGIYFINITAGKFVDQKKIILVK